MKTYFIKSLFILLFTTQLIGCEDTLNTEVHSQLSNKTVNTKDGINSVLNSAYSNAQLQGFVPEVAYLYVSSIPTAEFYSIRGSINSYLLPLSEFRWTSNNKEFRLLWNSFYDAIRDANIVLANIQNNSSSTEFKNAKAAEAKFIRGWSYSELYYKFGAVPLQKKPSDDPILARASVDTMRAFIEKQLIDASQNLPVNQQQYGRATKGAALGLLCKFYLNTKQWKKSANTAKQIMNMGEYGLVNNYSDVFSLDNEGNKELLWSLTYNTVGDGNTVDAFVFSPDYPLPEPNQQVFSAITYLYDSFVNSFSNNDARKNLIITQYSTTSGDQIQGLGNDKSLPNKYALDPNASGFEAGNDIPVIRYADILLSRAEALNELNGPNQASIKLINKVRSRAGVTTLSLSDFSDKTTLRDSVFSSRKKEFWFEAKSREDAIRHDTYISSAKKRGLNATKDDTLFAIPQQEIDANPKLEQNPGF